MRVLVIENSAVAPVGLFGEWLAGRGARLTTVAPESLPDRPDSDLIVILGSPAAVYDNAPWMLRQRDFLRAAMADGTGLVGICFGAQMIASVIGGTVAPMGRRHAGWIANDEATDPVWRGPWVRWHGDHVILPEGTEVMARDQGTIQAFGHGRAVAVQFHPEADAAIIDDWARATPAWLDENGLDLAALQAESQRRMRDNAAERDALFSELLRRAGV
jgi:GMP synthase (glutamine-hydrolysing)